ncbi:MAG TPA: hypothetical protein VH092_09335, partial [Urbifossiella sp.]|nr:hypothetical protein [Urbifossiella sp.]
GRGLADELAAALLAEVGAAARARFREIVAGLNAAGHRLTPYGLPGDGAEEAKDYSDQNQCALRLAVEVTVSTGYRDIRFEGGWGEARS